MFWNRLIDLQQLFIDKFESLGEEIAEPGMAHFNRPGWLNRVWKTESARRCHIDVVDARDTKKIWMMHVCVFPVLTNTSPIFGFDVISGKNKITGAFHDFSATTDQNHFMLHWFADSVQAFVPSKKRDLPEWARNIFSPAMVAAGNVNTPGELEEIIKLTARNLDYYFEQIGESDNKGERENVLTRQNYYCENQKQNPHTARVMKSLGTDADDVDRFCSDILFPIERCP